MSSDKSHTANKSLKYLPPEIAKKFADQRKKVSLEANVSKLIATCDQRLESQGEIKGEIIPNEMDEVWQEVMRHFVMTGWNVRTEIMNDKKKVWIWLD